MTSPIPLRKVLPTTPNDTPQPTPPQTPKVVPTKIPSIILKKKSVINENNNIKDNFECKNIDYKILASEECTLQIDCGIELNNVPFYTMICDDDLFNLMHYMKPVIKGETTFDICIKNSVNVDRNITISYITF